MLDFIDLLKGSIISVLAVLSTIINLKSDVTEY